MNQYPVSVARIQLPVPVSYYAKKEIKRMPVIFDSLSVR